MLKVWVFLLLMTQGMAQALIVHSAQVGPGKNFSVPIQFMAGSVGVFTTQMDVVLPTGFGVVGAERGNDLPGNWSIANAGGVRLILLDNSGGQTPLPNGIVAVYTLHSSGVSGDYMVDLTGIVASNSDGSGTVPITVSPGAVQVVALPTVPSSVGLSRIK